MADRFFYHSFPRPKKNGTPEEQIAKGLQILKQIVKTGLVLAPEVVVWKQPTQNGSSRKLEQLQKRICFTELSEPELAEHSRLFGPFALEFELVTLRHLGAIPVSYIPQTVDPAGASAVGATLVAELFDAKYTMDQLQRLREIVTQFETGIFQGKPIAPGSMINLQNTDSTGSIVQTNAVAPVCVKHVLDYLSFQNAPFALMRGVLNAMLSLFYPADNQFSETILGYYRQREWRIVSGIQVGDVPLSVPLSPGESIEVRDIDRDFWDRTLTISTPASHARTFTRINEAETIPGFGEQGIAKLIKSVIVPPSAIDQAIDLFPIPVRVLKQ